MNTKPRAGMENLKKAGEAEEDEVRAKLPPELWGEIGKFLASRLDVERFRSVCKSWRSSLPSPSRFPLSVPPPPGASDNELHTIAELDFYSVDHRFLMMFERVDEARMFRRSVLFPSKVQFDSQFSRLTFAAKTYCLRRSIPVVDSLTGANHGMLEIPYNMFVSKIVLVYSNENGGVDANYSTLSDVSVVALSPGGKLALLRLAGCPKNWFWDTDFCSDMSFEDIATYNGQLCAVDCCGRAFLMDYNSSRMIQVVSWFDLRRKFLFEACGELYLVTRSEVGSRVYKLSLPLHKWLKVQDLGNKAFVLGLEYSISIPRDVFTGIHFENPSLIRV